MQRDRASSKLAPVIYPGLWAGIYRGLVSENASWEGELSNTQKVWVQKKKPAQEA